MPDFLTKTPPYRRLLPTSSRASWLVGMTLVLPCVTLSEAQAETFYNITDYLTSSLSREALPIVWQPKPPTTLDYAGTLDAHWIAHLMSNTETLILSNTDARSRTGKADFGALTTMPDNCWGMNMGFGLVNLAQSANLTVTVEADNSNIKPGFALYKGWDTSKSSGRHGEIYFGDNNNAAGKISQNPLRTYGLTFLDDQLGIQPGGRISKTYDRLAAGNYEIFVTVGANDSLSGAYKVTLTTTPMVIQPPGAPTAVSAIPGDGQASVSWNAPDSNGGATLSGYTVSSSPDGKTCTTSNTQCRVTGLSNNISYRFSVRASNSAGDGPASESSTAVTPLAGLTGAPSVVLLSPAPAVFGASTASQTFSVSNDAWGNPENRTLGISRKSGWGIVKLTKGKPVKIVVSSESTDVHPGVSIWKRPEPGDYRFGPSEKVQVNGNWIQRPSMLLGNLLDFQFLPGAEYEQVRSNHSSGATDCGEGCELTVNGTVVSSGNIRMQYITGGFDKDGAEIPYPINGDPSLKAISDGVPGKLEIRFTPNETTTYQFAVGGIFPSGTEASSPGLMRTMIVRIQSSGVVP